MMSGGGPPGVSGGATGFGEVGHAAFNYQEMVEGTKRLKGSENNVETDTISMEKYICEGVVQGLLGHVPGNRSHV